MEDEPQFSVLHLIAGIFLGLGIGLGCFVLDIALVHTFGRLTPVVNLVVLVGAAIFAFKQEGQGLGRGMLISLSLVFIINTICGIGMIQP